MGWFFALSLSLAIAGQCVLLRERQDSGIATLQEDVISSLRSEFKFGLSSYLWKKLDFYMHNSEWEEKESGDQIAYYSSLVNTKEFRPLIEWSIAIDPSFTEAIAILSNTIAVSFGEVDEARDILRSAIIHHPSQKRIYRLYGDYGLIEYQLEKNYSRAIRFFHRCFETLSRLNPREWTTDDRFNLRNFGLSAAISAFKIGDVQIAYEFHRLSGFEQGPEEFQKEMDHILALRGELKLKEHHPLRRFPGKSSHDHDDHEAGELSREKEGALESEVLKKIVQNRSNLDSRLHLIPQLNPRFFYPVSWELTAILFGAFILQMGGVSLWRMNR
jgi:tetratricopeptide (TPR) repeat protein